MSEYIPIEIQAEILKRLPVKPLIQFRSVSKPWKSLIDSPDFIAAYGVRQTHPNRLNLRYENNDDDERFLTFVDNDDDDTFTKQDFALKVPDLIKTLEYLRVVGSSHGLMCFIRLYPDGDGTDMVVVWNPSISKSIGIEVPYIHNSPYDVHHIGFGVCPITFDPTILKIECCKTDFLWKVEVFTLSTGTWSILSTNLTRESFRLTGSQVVIDRFIYWPAFDFFIAVDGPFPFRIMSFDLTAKEFKEINLPDSLSNRFCTIQSISKLRESLVVFVYHREFEEAVPVCSLWMMKEQGVNRSFTKLYNINMPDDTIKRLLGFRKTGDLILETKQKRNYRAELEIYKPGSEAIDNLGIDGQQYSFFMCSYMETLLLHDQLDGFIYSIGKTDHK